MSDRVKSHNITEAQPRSICLINGACQELDATGLETVRPLVPGQFVLWRFVSVLFAPDCSFQWLLVQQGRSSLLKQWCISSYFLVID